MPGLIDALANGVSAATNAAAEYYGKSALAEDIARLQTEKEMRVSEHQDKLARSRAEWDVDTLGEKRNKLAAEGAGLMAQARLDVESKPENVQAGIDAKIRSGEAETAAYLKKWGANSMEEAKRKEARAGHIDDGAALRSIQVKTAQLAYDRAVDEAKIPASVMKSFDAKREAFKSGEQALAKSMAEGNFDEKSAGVQALLAKQDTLAADMAALMKPYMPKGEKSVDPGGGEKTFIAPPDSAIKALSQNPKLADQFDAKYGKGASEKVLEVEKQKTKAAPPREYTQREVENASKYGPFGGLVTLGQNANEEEERRRQEYIRNATQ